MNCSFAINLDRSKTDSWYVKDLICHISSRIAWRSTLALLNPALHAGCSVADTWFPRNQRPNSTSLPYPTRSSPNTPTQESKGLANCSWWHSRKHYCYVRTALSLAQKVGPMQGIGSCSNYCQARAVLPKSHHQRRATGGGREGICQL